LLEVEDSAYFSSLGFLLNLHLLGFQSLLLFFLSLELPLPQPFLVEFLFQLAGE